MLYKHFIDLGIYFPVSIVFCIWANNFAYVQLKQQKWSNSTISNKYTHIKTVFAHKNVYEWA